jgi:valyl-tRNA synthetase
LDLETTTVLIHCWILSVGSVPFTKVSILRCTRDDHGEKISWSRGRYLESRSRIAYLGVILFALLCGHLPFDDDNMKELYKKIAAGTYVTPEHLPRGYSSLIKELNI